MGLPDWIAQNWLAQHLGLTSLTLVAVALALYLVYAMLHPEEF